MWTATAQDDSLWREAMNVEYRVLGPLEVLHDGVPVSVPAGRGLVLLATLLLRPNQFVTVDELIDRVWDGDPPTVDRAHKTLQMVVRRLRVALGVADCVQTRTGGYVAVVEPDQLDLLRFRALAGSGDFGAASALWRRPVLGNVPSERLHREEVPQLVNERLTVLERRIDADLDRGLARELVAELRSLVTEHPLREPFWRHLMLALYRSGQQAEALSAYQDVRTRLADELGIDPGPALRELHQQILRSEVSPGGRVRVPRQLPAGVRNFVGRDEELKALDNATAVTVVHGVGGVGKTALVLRWGREAREDFPDGDLYVNLRGFDPELQPVDPAAAAEMMLVGLGVDEVPAAAEVRLALLRTTLASPKIVVTGAGGSARSCRGVLVGLAGRVGGSGDWGQGDGVAECFELADVVAFLVVVGDAVVVEVGAEVVEVAVRVGQQVPDDDQGGAADGDHGSLRAAASGDAPVAFTEEGVGAGGADGGFAEDAGEVAVAVPAGGVALLAGGFLHAGCEPGPGCQVAGGGEPGHVQPDLGEDHRRGDWADAGDLIEPGDGAGERGTPSPRSCRPGRRCRRRSRRRGRASAAAGRRGGR